MTVKTALTIFGVFFLYVFTHFTPVTWDVNYFFCQFHLIFCTKSEHTDMKGSFTKLILPCSFEMKCSGPVFRPLSVGLHAYVCRDCILIIMRPKWALLLSSVVGPLDWEIGQKGASFGPLCSLSIHLWLVLTSVHNQIYWLIACQPVLELLQAAKV